MNIPTWLSELRDDSERRLSGLPEVSQPAWYQSFVAGEIGFEEPRHPMTVGFAAPPEDVSDSRG